MNQLARLILLASALTLGAGGSVDADSPRSDAYGDPLPPGALFRFGSARLRHGAGIGNSALSPDGKLLASVATYSTVIWDLQSGKRLWEFRFDAPIRPSVPGITFSPNGARVAVRGDGTAYVWDVKTGKEIWRRETPNGRHSTLCRFTPDGKQLILSDKEGTHFWDLEANRITRTVPVSYVDQLSPDLMTYVCRSPEGMALILGAMQTGKETNRLEITAESHGIESVAFAPDGRSLAIVAANTEIQVRDLPEGKVRVAFPLPDNLKRTTTGTSWVGLRLGFTVDGRTLLMGTERDGWIRRWDLASKQELPALKRHYGLHVNFMPPNFHCLPDGRTLVSTGADGLIRRWDLHTGQELSQPDRYAGRPHAAYSTDGRFVAMGDGRGRIDLWDARSGKLLRTLRQEGSAVLQITFAPDGKTLAIALAPATVQLYDVPSGNEGRIFPFEVHPTNPLIHRLQFSPDGRSLCVCSNGQAMQVWNVTTGELRWRGGSTSEAVYSPDGTTLAVGQGFAVVFLDAANGAERPGGRVQFGKNFYRDRVETFAFAPGGNGFALSLSGGNLHFLDPRSGTELQRLLAVDNSQLDKIVAPIPLSHRVRTLAFSPDGKWFASGGTETVVCLWETATTTEVLKLECHEPYATIDGVSAVAFSPDGRSLFTGGVDAQAYLWTLRPKLAPDTKLDALWNGLAGDAAGAYWAIWTMSESLATVGFLREKLAAVKPPEKDRLAKLIAELDSASFPAREAAGKSLAELGDVVVPALEHALKSRPSLEAQQRFQKLLDELKRGTSVPELRRQRAVRVLELAGTAEARAVLKEWAGGAPGARFTEDAKAALNRLTKGDELRAPR